MDEIRTTVDQLNALINEGARDDHEEWLREVRDCMGVLADWVVAGGHDQDDWLAVPVLEALAEGVNALLDVWQSA